MPTVLLLQLFTLVAIILKLQLITDTTRTATKWSFILHYRVIEHNTRL